MLPLTVSAASASVTVEGGTGLKVGQGNEIKVICTAEDGTQKVYTVIAKRAAAHDSSVDPTEPETEPTTVPETEPTDNTAANTTNGLAWWLLIVGIVALAAGLVGGYFGKDYIAKKK